MLPTPWSGRESEFWHPSGSLTGEISDNLTGTFGANGGYLGVPLLLIVGWFAVSGRRRGDRLLFAGLAGATLLAMGAFLRVAGSAILPLPWLVLGRLPILDRVLPERLIVF